jgi:hypothetical protein
VKEYRIFSSLHGKRLLWGTSVKVFCDGGRPRYTVYPRIRRMGFAPYWGLTGFSLYLLGREFNFVFGRDKHKLYR